MKKTMTFLSVLMMSVFVTISYGDEWDYANDPTLFFGEFEYNLSSLPRADKASNVDSCDNVLIKYHLIVSFPVFFNFILLPFR